MSDNEPSNLLSLINKVWSIDYKTNHISRRYSCAIDCLTTNNGTNILYVLFVTIKSYVMMDNRNTSNWEEHKNQDPHQNQGRGSKEDAIGERPQDRLKDGTNDLQDGDQQSNLGEPSERSSEENTSSKANS
jgi:hypothetical protein